MSITHVKESETMLALAFEKFQLASEKLEKHHDELQREIDSLRIQLAEKDKEVKRAEKLALLGETAAGIAHEVRNPLGAIKLFLSALEKQVTDRPRAIEITKQIQASITTLDNVVSNILHCSVDKQLALAPVNFQSIVLEQKTLLETRTQGRVTINLKYDAPQFMVGNEDAMRQILHNVLNNAAQAMNHNGEILVDVSTGENSETRVLVKDQGPGFPVGMIERAFEPFVTSKNEGTGLGLAIVRRLMQQHGGDIIVYNNDGAVCEMIFPSAKSRVIKVSE